MSSADYFDRKANYDLSLQSDDNFADPNSDLQGFVDEPENEYRASSVEEGLETYFSSKGGSTTQRGRVVKCVFITLVCLAVIGIIVGIGVSVIDMGGADGTQHGLSIPSVPVDLHVVCAPMNLRSEEGYSNCLKLCQPAECCELPPDSSKSCVKEHRHQCELYRSSCQHLDHLKPDDFVAPKDESASDSEDRPDESKPLEKPGVTTMTDYSDMPVGGSSYGNDAFIKETDIDLFSGGKTSYQNADPLQEDTIGSEDADSDVDLFGRGETNSDTTNLEADSAGSEDADIDFFGGDETNSQDAATLEADTDIDFYSGDKSSSQVTVTSEADTTGSEDSDIDFYGGEESNSQDVNTAGSEEADINLYGSDETTIQDTDTAEADIASSEDFDVDLFDGEEINVAVTDLPDEEDFDIDLFGEDNEDAGPQEAQSYGNADTDLENLDLYAREEISEADEEDVTNEFP
mmetsp:Transcript_23961/g.36447  ORF Transcript_23961/g.36447 Transcript_23961/m.36447 type:complete len:461 (-) Transcript_23961:164-1546(-)|eukprot:CAMPEP_0178917134 /NCGR_PEP_ID=MMETSP0786-20121207/13072_1 /TAXON_ID=186022 /ORGANISM="Thalassionema frauenfeldii, Strain CCMP 1798" /LENGTH=460 /DNA_ID=CAMNT_0020590639 /DNA_START=89 /DNA_END=1471 /DNA_ORIENTATION=-